MDLRPRSRMIQGHQPAAAPARRTRDVLAQAQPVRLDRAELESRGVPFIAPVAENGEGYKAATFVDPEGNRIQLFEWARPTEGTA